MPAEALPRPPLAPRAGQRGVTLVEMIVALIVLGALLPLVSMFVRNQIEGYTDVVRRAELVDIADGASRRMARDLQRALPNSVRTHGTDCLEFIPTKAGGRYRAETSALGTGDTLDFPPPDSPPDGSFDLFGSNPGIAVGDLVAVYNLGISGAADAYDHAGSLASSTVTDVTGIEAGDLSGETKLRIGGKKFPLVSPGSRFHVIPGGSQVVAYVCVIPVGGEGHLYRHSYRLNETTGACPTPPANAPILASNITSCRFAYTQGALQRMGLVEIELAISRDDETIRLYRQVNVTNTP